MERDSAPRSPAPEFGEWAQFSRTNESRRMEQGMRYLPAARKHPFPMPGYGAWMQDDVSQKYRSGPDSRAALVPQGGPPGPGGGLPSGVPAFGKAFTAAPNAMARRNERERKRVRLVNNGFNTLRAVLPQNKNTKKKLSKMETLRSAIEYINELQLLLHSQHSQLCGGGSSYGDEGAPWPPQGWEEAMGWDTRTSPASAGSSPQTCLSPDNISLDFSAYP